MEMLVSIAIIMAMSSLFFVNYKNTNKRSELNVTKQKLASDIRLAQNYSLGSKTYDGSNAPAGGWGVHFSMSDPARYILFADQDGDKLYNNDDDRDKDKKIIALPGGVTIDSLSPLSPAAALDIIFLPPDPTVYVNGLNNVSAEIILRENINNSTGSTTVNFFGLIDTD